MVLSTEPLIMIWLAPCVGRNLTAFTFPKWPERRVLMPRCPSSYKEFSKTSRNRRDTAKYQGTPESNVSVCTKRQQPRLQIPIRSRRVSITTHCNKIRAHPGHRGASTRGRRLGPRKLDVEAHAKVIKMRPDLTPIWRVSDAALCSREPGEFQVSMGGHWWWFHDFNKI